MKKIGLITLSFVGLFSVACSSIGTNAPKMNKPKLNNYSKVVDKDVFATNLEKATSVFTNFYKTGPNDSFSADYEYFYNSKIDKKYRATTSTNHINNDTTYKKVSILYDYKDEISNYKGYVYTSNETEKNKTIEENKQDETVQNLNGKPIFIDNINSYYLNNSLSAGSPAMMSLNNIFSELSSITNIELEDRNVTTYIDKNNLTIVKDIDEEKIGVTEVGKLITQFTYNEEYLDIKVIQEITIDDDSSLVTISSGKETLYAKFSLNFKEIKLKPVDVTNLYQRDKEIIR